MSRHEQSEPHEITAEATLHVPGGQRAREIIPMVTAEATPHVPGGQRAREITPMVTAEATLQEEHR